MLLNEAKRRYPIGTDIALLETLDCNGRYINICKGIIDKDTNHVVNINSVSIIEAYCYKDGKWAKPIVEPKPLTKEEELALYNELHSLINFCSVWTIGDEQIQKRIKEIERLLF